MIQHFQNDNRASLSTTDKNQPQVWPIFKLGNSSTAYTQFTLAGINTFPAPGPNLHPTKPAAGIAALEGSMGLASHGRSLPGAQAPATYPHQGSLRFFFAPETCPGPAPAASQACSASWKH